MSEITKIKLQTRPREGSPDTFDVLVDGRWRNSKWYRRFCSCREGIEVEYFGVPAKGRKGTNFWWECAECGNYSRQTFYAGWRPPRDAGGNSHGHLANRRRRSGY